jgi:hypothetical protein
VELLGAAFGARGPFEEGNQLANRMVAMPWVPEREFVMDGVAVPTPVPGYRHIPRLSKIGHDCCGCALGDSDRLGDVPEPPGRVPAKVSEHVSVVRDEPEPMIWFYGA